MFKAISKEQIENHNKKNINNLKKDYEFFLKKTKGLGININNIKIELRNFSIALPSWGLGTGGTRFGKFPIVGEPNNIFEKIEDCAVINDLIGITNSISLHFPWDNVEDFKELKEFTKSYGLKFDAVNSNTFEDFKDYKHSFKFGSLTHTDKSIRDKAIELNVDCIKKGEKIGSKALTVWIPDGTNYPGQQDFSKSLDRYINSMKKIYSKLPSSWKIFIEHKPFEPAFYSTVINDWGSSYYCAKLLGKKAFCLIDLGHHLPNTNIEMIVSRLADMKKLGGFHFNDSKYGDDDLDSGSINPFALFLIFNELTNAKKNKKLNSVSYMIDQSHNITDPIESLIMSAIEIQRAFAKSLLINYKILEKFQKKNDAIYSLNHLKNVFNIDVTPLLQVIRYESGNVIKPLEFYRNFNYRKKKSKIRKKKFDTSATIL